jgi:subtilisin family serine protease
MTKDTSMFHLPPFRVETTLTALSETIDWSLTNYHIPVHWKATRGQNVKVAVLDTGIDEAHPDLMDAIDDARDFTRSRTPSTTPAISLAAVSAPWIATATARTLPARLQPAKTMSA